MAQFEKGNKLAKGGARPGSGPKGLTKKQILDAAQQIKVQVDHGDGEGPRPTQIGLACFMILAGLANGEFNADGPRDDETGELIGDSGCDKARIQIAACNQLLNRLIGRPQIAVELSGSIGVDLRALIGDARRTKTVVADISAMAPPPPALPSSARGTGSQVSKGSVDVPRDRGDGRKGSGGKPRAAGKGPRKGGGR
ncbi:MAG TPA: hypothetical protein VFF65_02105 [Phycisphaerales bacterium]|nr:hypothetical protein [Phycisphaerales bacterium]